MIYEWVHIQVCPGNPQYPRGGTWIYDRAGWCPGEAVDWFDLDLTPLFSLGVPVTFNYGVYDDDSYNDA